MDRRGQKRVLIAGGGVAALEAALALRRLAEDRVRIELLAPEPRFWYRPLAVAAPFELGDVLHFELGALAREIGADFTPGGLVGIDAWRHVAHTSKNTQLEYDMLLVACGALPMPAIPGALTFRGPADIELIGSVLRELASGAAGSVAFVIPWGAVYSLPAYELALLTSAHLDRLGLRGVEVSRRDARGRAATGVRPTGERGDPPALRRPRHRAPYRRLPDRRRRRNAAADPRRRRRGRSRRCARPAEGRAARRDSTDRRRLRSRGRPLQRPRCRRRVRRG